MKISFDYDGTLFCSNPMVKNLCSELIKAGTEVFVLTYRHYPYEAAPVIALAVTLGIPAGNVLFAGGGDKIDFIRQHGINCHVDDDAVEVHRINTTCGPIAVLVNYTTLTGDGFNADY